MDKVYAMLIVKGKKTLSDVPEKLKDSVVSILKEWGRDDLTGESNG